MILAVVWWYRGQGGHGGHVPSGMTVKGCQKSKMKILIEQVEALPLFSIEYQLRVTFKKHKIAI